MTIKLSLCIPTMRRWDTFLSKNLPKYIANPHIDEIIVCDETGEDAEAIRTHIQSEKVKVYANEHRLGVFLNKQKVVSLATNDWVCLMDSDNFADVDYFVAFLSYIERHGINSSYIYCPSAAAPRFAFKHVEGSILNKQTIGLALEYDAKVVKYNGERLLICLNTGNYILNKSQFLNIEYPPHYIENLVAADVLFTNYLLLNKGVSLVIVPNMKYEHVVHDGSLYLNTIEQCRPYCDAFNKYFVDWASSIRS